MAEQTTIYAALAKAQSEMGKALKSAANPHFKSRYADLAEVMDACLPALNSNGIAVFQPMREADGGRYVVTILAHASGETIECAVPLIVQKNDMQGLGSAITYARRYGLMSMAGIAPEDDDGNAAANAAPTEAPKPYTPGPRQAKAETPLNGESIQRATEYLQGADTLEELQRRYKSLPEAQQKELAIIRATNQHKAALQAPPADDLGGDNIPY